MSTHAIKFWNHICNSLDQHTINTTWYESATLHYRNACYYNKVMTAGDSILSMTPEERITLDLIVYNSISE